MQGAPPIPALFAVAFLAAGLSAVDQPARASAIPRLVPAERLPSAIALNQLNYQMASIVGPAVGGILIATVGLAGAYAVDLVSFVASLVALLAIQPLPPIGVVTRPGLDAIREGLRFAQRRRAILGIVRDRLQRDGLRDADVALPGPRARRLPDRCRPGSG